jgi:hypothetical protein
MGMGALRSTRSEHGPPGASCKSYRQMSITAKNPNWTIRGHSFFWFAKALPPPAPLRLGRVVYFLHKNRHGRRRGRALATIPVISGELRPGSSAKRGWSVFASFVPFPAHGWLHACLHLWEWRPVNGGFQFFFTELRAVRRAVVFRVKLRLSQGAGSGRQQSPTWARRAPVNF